VTIIMPVLLMGVIPKPDALTLMLIVMMEILVLLIRAMFLLVVLMPPLYALSPMSVILSVVFIRLDVFKMKSTVMTTIIAPLTLVIPRKVANMRI